MKRRELLKLFGAAPAALVLPAQTMKLVSEHNGQIAPPGFMEVELIEPAEFWWGDDTSGGVAFFGKPGDVWLVPEKDALRMFEHGMAKAAEAADKAALATQKVVEALQELRAWAWKLARKGGP